MLFLIKILIKIYFMFNHDIIKFRNLAFSLTMADQKREGDIKTELSWGQREMWIDMKMHVC